MPQYSKVLLLIQKVDLAIHSVYNNDSGILV